MKKKILLTLAAFAAFAALTACEKTNVTTKQTTTEVVTTTADNNNSNELTNNHDRGTIDNSLPKIDLPDVLFPKDEVEQTLDATDESISLGDGDYVETNAGSGLSETVEGERYLTATVNVGYNFLGWYLGDKLLSTELKYKCKDGENGVEAKFALKEEFKYLEFTSSETECVVTGLKENCPAVLVIPEGVTEIAENAFRGAYLTNVTLPESLTTIGERAFYYSKLTSLTFKKVPNPSNIGWDVVDGTNLKVVVVPNDYTETEYLIENVLSRSNVYGIKNSDTNYHIANDFVFHLDEGEWDLIAYTGDSKNIVLPEADDVVSSYYIASYLFSESDIESIKISSITKSVGYNAFYNCDNLSEVTLSDGILSIIDYAFYDCDSLAEIVIPDSVTYIGEESFEYCDNLSIVTIGKNVETIDYDAFYGCNKLNIVYDYSDYLTITNDYNNSSSGYYYIDAQYIFTDKSQTEDLIKDDFIYEINENYVTLQAYTGNSKDVVIPTFDDKFIILGNSLFSGNNKIETVTFNEYCREIESYCFSGCDNLKSINTSGVTEIGYRAFYDCDNLINAILPSVTYIDDEAFNGCDELKTVTSPELTNLGSEAFYYCESLESIDLTNVNAIWSETFYYCYALKEAIMTKATSIGEEAFYHCHNLEKAIMPKAESLGYAAFSNCYKLRTVDISSLKTIGNHSNLFYNCYSLLTITFPATLTSVDSFSYAFETDTNYRLIVEIINYSSLTTLKNLTNAKNEITDPTTQNSILDYDYENNLITYVNSDGKKILAGVIDRSVKKLVIPNDIYEMRVGSLYGCDQLEELEISKMDMLLGYYFDAAFRTTYTQYYQNYNRYAVPSTLKTLKLGDGITYIPNYALYDLNFIENLYIGKNITSISSSNPFYYNRFKNIYYDGTIEDWCSLRFDSLEENPLYYGGKIYFKDGDSYSELEVVEIPNTVTAIGDYQFYRFSSIKKVILPNTITSIGSNAFYNCKNLKGIYIESGLLTIGSEAFEGCTTLISVRLGDSLTSIGDYAFKGCSLLYNVEIPNTLSSLGAGVFKDCETLESLTLEETSVTAFKDYLFSNCYNLESLGFPTSLTSIESTTFENCDKLVFRVYKNGCYFGTETNPYRWLIKARAKTILDCIVHDDCEKIYDGAFSGCKNLKKIVIPATCTDCGSCLYGLTNVEYVEAPYTSTKDFGNGLFGTANANLTKIKTIIVNGGAIANNAFTGISDDVSITITGDITAIGDYALKGRKITSLIATSALKTIGQYAFLNCTLLTEVNLGSVESIGIGAFKGCTALATLTVSTSTKFTTIPESAFENCSSLTSLVISNSKITTIGDYAFRNAGLTSISGGGQYNGMFNNVSKIGKESFANVKITKIDEVSSTLQYIGVNAFKDCLLLTTITEYTSFIGTGMFEGCTALKTVNSNANSINSKGFKDCTSLKSITMNHLTFVGEDAFSGSGLESFTNTCCLRVDKYAFRNATNLKTVSITGSGTTFDYYHSYNTYKPSYNNFEGCISLTSVTLPSDFTSVTVKMFLGCTSLASFDFSKITTINDYAFDNTGFTSLEIPSTITTFGYNCFQNCKNLETVVMHRSLGSGLFKNCTALTSVTLDSASTTIAAAAFEGCTALDTISLHEGITNIYAQAFYKSGLAEVTLPSTLIEIGNYAFANCDIAEITLPSSLTTLGNYAFYYSQLEEVIIPASTNLTSIGQYTFAFCFITEFVIPSSVTSIGNYAFKACYISEITIPNTVSSMGVNVFEYCASLTKATIKSKNINTSAFEGCDGLKELIVSDGVEVLPSYLVRDCISLTKVTLPSTLKTIRSYAFYNCSSLETITLPKDLTTIDSYAFYNCTNLKTINNYSDLGITVGSSDLGYVAYYADTVNSTFSNYTPIVVDGFVFAFIDDKAYLMGYEGIGRVLELPSSLTYNEVTYNEYDIYYNAFFNRDLLSITIPSSVKAIYDYAFGGCYKLVEIYNLSDIDFTLGASDNGGIAQYALVIHTSKSEPSILLIENGFVLGYYEEDDQKIGKIIGYAGTETNINIPTSFTLNEEEINIKVIDAEAFMDSGIVSVIIPSGITTISRDAFKNCTSLQTIEVSDTVVNFGATPFSGCNQIKKATIPTWMIKYVNYQDNSNNALEELIITNGETIEANVLKNMSNLSKVTLGTSVKTINGYAFSYCSKLVDINLENVETIKSYAFDHCSGLKIVTLPDGITVEQLAFNYCTSIDYVLMPQNWANINTNAFRESCASYADEMKILCIADASYYESLSIVISNSSYYGITYANKYYYSETELSGNYWHYDSNGNPTTYKYEKALAKLDLLVSKMREYLDYALEGVESGEGYKYIGTDDSMYICPYSNNTCYYINSNALLYILSQEESEAETLALLPEISGRLQLFYNTTNNRCYYNIESSPAYINGFRVYTVTDRDRYVLSTY